MKKKIFIIIIVLVNLLILSCIDTPKLVSIGFIDDKTIEYEIEFSLRSPSGNGNGYDVKLISMSPDNGSTITSSSSSNTKGKLHFTKAIPDGTTIDLEFCYSSTGKRAFTHSFIKGKAEE